MFRDIWPLISKFLCPKCYILIVISSIEAQATGWWYFFYSVPDLNFNGNILKMTIVLLFWILFGHFFFIFYSVITPFTQVLVHWFLRDLVFGPIGMNYLCRTHVPPVAKRIIWFCNSNLLTLLFAPNNPNVDNMSTKSACCYWEMLIFF